MIESKNPEIDVQELMVRVRREASKARPPQRNGDSPSPLAAAVPAVVLPPVPDLPPPPPFQSSGPVDPKKDRLDHILTQARKMTEVSPSIPKLFRGFFRKQGGFNRAVLETVAAVVKTNAQLNKRVQELNAAAQQHNYGLQQAAEHRRAESEWMRTAAPVISSFAALQERLAQTEAHLAAVQSAAEEAAQVAHEAHNRQDAAQAAIDRLHDSDAGARVVEARVEHLGTTITAVQPLLQLQTDQIRDFRGDLSRTGDHLRDLQSQADVTGENVRNLQRTTEQLLVLRDQTEQSAEHLRNLQIQADRQGDRVGGLDEQTERHTEHLRNLQTQADRQGEHVRNLQRSAEQLLVIHEQNERAAEHLRNLQTQADRQTEHLEGIRQQLTRDAEHLRNLQTQADRAGEHLRHLQDESERATDQLRDFDRIRATTARVEAEIAHLADFRRTLARLEERQVNDSVYVKGQIAQHASLLQQWLTEPNTKKGARATAAKAAEPAPNGALDTFYLSFENRFRGERADIKERVRFYLPLLKKTKAGTAARPILDVGCGRGEWLELLAENDLHGSGVDLNSAMISECEARNFDVTLADAIEHLRSLRARTLGCVTGFHIIEHLPFTVLLELFAQTLRVLKPGGLAIFESPNCKNLMVGACYFNVDPTHRNPVFPETAEFMMETQGFDKVQLEYLAPAQRPFAAGDHDAEVLNDLLFGPQDFAVIGRKPAAR
jgi:O-antigen chain-terminating methyltransferase